jgi:hypothetical protein
MPRSPFFDLSERRQNAVDVRAACEIGLIFLLFFLQAGWPVPDVNEPHYLSKARHYWEPAWCANDFFCDSADAHQVFYWTFGWLTRYVSFATAAWVGRIVTWGLIAWAWRRLSWTLVPVAWYSVLSAALWVMLTDRCQMAAEWVIGGVEAKGFAYALVLLGIEMLVRGRWTGAWLLFGAASSFHVIVGGWSVVASGIVWMFSRDRPSLSQSILPLAGGLLLALPGLAPAVALTSGVDPQTVADANRIYVYERLYHHLLPQRFPPLFILRHLALVAGFAALVAWAGAADARFARLRVFVAAAVGIAACGMLLAMTVPLAPEFAAGVLRYYWFRMSDVMVPLGVALTICWMMARWQEHAERVHAVMLGLLLILTALHFGDFIGLRRERPWPPADTSVVNLDEWRELCAWIAEQTPPEAVFLTPRLAQTFRWYAGRAEVANRKDIPQDAAGLVEWWRRVTQIYRADAGTPQAYWRESLAPRGSRALVELGREFGADYLITTADPPLALERVGPRGASYAIYRLPPNDRVDRSAAPAP